MALTKYNRRTVNSATGAVYPNAWVEFRYQASGSPAPAYSDEDGTVSLGSKFQVGEDGAIEVFLNAGIYLIVITDSSDDATLEEITFEAIINSGYAQINPLIDDAETFVTSTDETFTDVNGGTRYTISGVLANSAQGNITIFSELVTYTEITGWVDEDGVIYRPKPSALPIAAGPFDPTKWVVAQIDGVFAVDSVADLIAGEYTQDQVYVRSYYPGWAATAAGPRGGHFRHKTGASNTNPTAGGAVSVSAIGTGVQAGYCWDASGAEWRIDSAEEFDAFEFGVKSNGTDADCDALQMAIDAAKNLKVANVILPAPDNNYRIEKTISIPIDVNLTGAGRYVYIAVRAGVYTNNYAFLINTTDGTDWIDSNPNNRTSIISGLRIETDQPTLSCFGFSGSPVFEDLSFKFFARSIVGSSQYNDFVSINRVICSHNIAPSTYQVELNNTGDGVLINQLHCFNVANDPAAPLKSIKVQNNAVQITNFLGGDIELINCTAMSAIRNAGMDGGKLILNKSHLTIEDCAFSALESEEVIQFENDGAFTRNVILNNVTISHDIFRGSWEPYLYDIKVANGISIDIRNVFRRIIASDNPSSRNLLGVQMNLESGSPFTSFNKYSHFYSVLCRIEDENIVGSTIEHSLPQTTLTVFTGLGLFASDAWEEATNTYYYKIVPYWDVGRQVSRNTSAERSLALTNGGSAAILEIGDGSYSGQMILRVYRGTNPNSYTAFADIPVVDSPSLVDNGNTISGIAWSPRGAAPITSTPNALNMLGFKFSMNNATVKATAVPTQGVWVEDDEALNTSFTVDANSMILYGWKRITSGSGNVLGTDWAPMYFSTVSPAT